MSVTENGQIPDSILRACREAEIAVLLGSLSRSKVNSTVSAQVSAGTLKSKRDFFD
jgi:hypothetical protein